MTRFAARALVALALGTLAACAPQAKESAKAESPPDQAQPAPPPSASRPPAPATPPPAPAPATPAPPAKAPAPPPAVAAPPPPAPAPAPPAPEPPKAEAPQTLVVSVGRANMREKPDTKARILQVLTRGTKLVVVSKGNQWYRVRLAGGAEGWVAESVVKPE
jgi:uncharacterized protein YgiM (DUF1202 family)